MQFANQPLAERLRPSSLDEYIGQEHLIGEGAVLRKMIESGKISSFLLWGPPGVGKTTLAKIIANTLNRPFYTLSAINSGVKDVRDVIAIENTGKYTGKYLILGGKISPMEGVGPNQLNIPSIEKKLNDGKVKEFIFALSATMEGDTTAYYIYKKFKNVEVNFSSIARGISVGDELEYADEISLGRSIMNRLPYNEGNS